MQGQSSSQGHVTKSDTKSRSSNPSAALAQHLPGLSCFPPEGMLRPWDELSWCCQSQACGFDPWLCHSLELGLMILVGPSQLGIFCELHEDKVPREGLESPSLAVPQRGLDVAMGTRIRGDHGPAGLVVGLGGLGGLCQPW